MQEENIETAKAADAAQEKEGACSVTAEALIDTGGETREAANKALREADEYDNLSRALRDRDVRERLIFGNEEICNEIITRYLDEMSAPRSVPLVRGFSAISPLPRPKSLDEAKAIVDKGKIR